jgi:hypothetical protein
MTNRASALQLIDGSGLPEYPISANARLDSHYFLQWNLKRWRNSDFRKKAEPEVGWFGFQLFCIAQDGAPIGTLPIDDYLLAFDLNLPLEKWKALMDRTITPLHGWYKVQCDNGEIRYAHEVVTEVAKTALKSSLQNKAKVETRKQNKRLLDLQAMIERVGAKQLLKASGFLERFDDWLVQHHDGVQRREPLIRASLDQFIVENG